MADDDLSVRFGADTAPLAAGAATATAAVEGFGEDVGAICAAILAQTEAMQAGFAELGQTITASMSQAASATAEEEEELQGLLATVRGGVASFNELKESIFGFGEAVMAAFAVEEIAHFTEELGEAGERVQHTSQAFGLTTAQTLQLQAAFTAAGAGPDALQSALVRVDRAASQAASGNARAGQAFKALGIDINAPAEPAERLKGVLEGLSNLQGPEKAEVAYAVFGRQMVQYAGIIGATKEQLEGYLSSADKMGANSTQAIGKMAALGGALNEQKVAFSGLQQVMGDALSPALHQVVDQITGTVVAFNRSYESGGAVRQIMATIGVTVSTVGTIFEEIGEVVAQVLGDFIGHTNMAHDGMRGLRLIIEGCGASVVLFGSVVETVGAVVGMVVDNMETAFRTLGQVIGDALTGHMAQIKADWDQGNREIESRTKQAAQEIGRTWAETYDKLDKMGRGDGDQEASPKSVKGKAWDDGSHHGKKPKDDLTSEWTEQLRQIQDAQQNWYRDQNQLAADFWAGIVAKGQGSAKDQQEAEDRLAEARKALDQEGVDSAIDAAKKQSDAAHGNVAEVEQIYSRLEDVLRTKHVEGGDDWAKVEKAKAEAVKKAAEEQIAAQEKVWQLQARTAEAGIATSARVNDMKFDERGKDIDAQHSSGNINDRQALSEHIQLVQERAAADAQSAAQAYAAKMTDLDNEYIAEAGNADKQRAIGQQLLDAKLQFDNEQVVSAQQTADKIADLQRAAAERTRQTWSQNISSVVSTFGNGMLNMAQKGGTLGSVMLKVGEDMEQKFVSAIETMVTRWLTNLAIGAAGAEAQSALTSQAQIGKAAETAAANTYAAIAAIPIIGPVLAPPAAAAAFVAVEAFASASGGYDIPAGVNPMTQLHAQEMVLPASIAQPLRGMIAANSNTPGQGGAGPSGGDTFHMAINALDSRSVRRMMTQGNVRSAAQAFRKHA